MLLKGYYKVLKNTSPHTYKTSRKIAHKNFNDSIHSILFFKTLCSLFFWEEGGGELRFMSPIRCVNDSHLHVPLVYWTCIFLNSEQEFKLSQHNTLRNEDEWWERIKCVIQLKYSCILSVEITSDFIATYILQPSHCIKPLMNARVINGI